MLFILRSHKNISHLIAVLTVNFSTQALPQLIYQSHRDRKFSVPCW